MKIANTGKWFYFNPEDESEGGLKLRIPVIEETEEDRIKLGKNPEGFIKISAESRGDKVHIIVEDEAIYGSRNILTKIIIALNLPYRFSESHNEFQDITKLPFTHLVNIVAKDMEGLNKDELKAYMNTNLFRYYATKV